MLLTPAFRNIDSSFEEVARVCGAARLETLARVVVPLVLPAILVVIVLAAIRAMQNFEMKDRDVLSIVSARTKKK